MHYKIVCVCGGWFKWFWWDGGCSDGGGVGSVQLCGHTIFLGCDNIEANKSCVNATNINQNQDYVGLKKNGTSRVPITLRKPSDIWKSSRKG